MYFKQERNAAIALGVLLVVMSCLVIWSNTAVTKTQSNDPRYQSKSLNFADFKC